MYSKILACSAEINPDPSQQQRMRRLLSFDVDFDFLINVAIREGLAGLLYKNLKTSGLLGTLSQSQRERLQSLYYRTVIANLRLFHDLKKILDKLNQKKIKVVLLQGVVLLQHVYDDIGLRPMTDIDFWVLKKDYAGLINVLSIQDYKRDPLYPNTFRKGSTTFDFHTHILWADRIRAHKLLLTKSQEYIYQEARILHINGQKALCLSPYDEVLYLSLHALKHNVERLIWLVDIKNILATWKRSDWAGLINRARELGQEKTVSFIFFLLLHMFDFNLPPEAWRLMEKKRLNFLERKVLWRRVKKDSLPAWSPLVLFSTGKGLRKSFFIIFETLFPRPEILRQVFEDTPNRKVWQLYGMRVLQLLGMIRE